MHLFERDCSLQRRYQKVIEEAPAPGLAPARRAAMGAAAVAAAQATDYVGAGTVEFIAAGDRFYFMEMNTRLQVEHPVTEMITGQDLVAWQIRVAVGEPLPLAQDDLAIDGHAIEARIYAENPARDFLPAAGRLVHLRLPAESAHARVDSGVREGDEVSVHYDPMIAKVIVWDRDRPAALRRLRAALAETEVVGPATNVAFLAAVALHPDFTAGTIDTGFIARHRADLLAKAGPVSDEVLAVAALCELLARRAEAECRARRSSEPHSPWHDTAGWRLNVATHTRLLFRDGPGDAPEIPVIVTYRAGGYGFDLPGGHVEAHGDLTVDGTLLVDLDGRRLCACVVRQGGDHGTELTVLLRGARRALHLVDPLEAVPEDEATAGTVAAPMPGKVVKVHVRAGESVARGAPLVVLEAMKMEHCLTAPVDATVGEVYHGAGELVEEGAKLLVLEPARNTQ